MLSQREARKDVCGQEVWEIGGAVAGLFAELWHGNTGKCCDKPSQSEAAFMLLADLRIGEGHDTHRTIPGRPLMIGGICITDAAFGLDGHSDADVLLHALTDAMLGATGQGDIGEWFPNTEQWKDADSSTLLRRVSQSVSDQGWRIVNLDCTIHAEQPRLGAWKPIIRKRLAEILEVPESRINVKAKSGERVGPVGRGESISADAVILIGRETQQG